MSIKFEMDDDGCQSPGFTLARAILAAYPAHVVELVLFDLLETIVISDAYEEATKYLRKEAAGCGQIDRLRAILLKIAGHWERHRTSYYGGHQVPGGPDSA